METQHLYGLGDSHHHAMRSATIGRPFHIYVMTPDGYDESRHRGYPTLYVLDGGALFPLVAAYYRYLRADDELPDLIIVGISYGAADFADGNFRSTDFTAPSDERDYWGGANAFQQFLQKELLPFIETEYASDAARRILFGQSLGGQFVLYSAQTAPALFWGRIASNPALHRNLPYFLSTVPEGRGDTRLFVAMATDDDPRFRVPALAWADAWQRREPKPWQLRVVDLPLHGHASAPPAAFRDGLRWLFSDRSDPAGPPSAADN
ncbi:MAG: alpha/beta hydrolase-fold protein [Woeseiaceae bacterium]|nr:alpha/beta hydrolase-fold protein [Woeseiaceae bacterium]